MLLKDKEVPNMFHELNDVFHVLGFGDLNGYMYFTSFYPFWLPYSISWGIVSPELSISFLIAKKGQQTHLRN